MQKVPSVLLLFRVYSRRRDYLELIVRLLVLELHFVSQHYNEDEH